MPEMLLGKYTDHIGFRKSKRGWYMRLLSQLETEFSSWESAYEELSRYMLPRNSRFSTSDRNRGNKKHQSIMNSIGILTTRSLTAGMMSGLTNPSRKWFGLSISDRALNEDYQVRVWLETVEQTMRDLFSKSNFYLALSACYRDLAVYGTHCSLMLEDDKEGMRMYPLPVGSYYLATDDRNEVDTVARKFMMTARQIVHKYGRENASDRVLSLVDSGSGEQWIEVCHVICPNPRHQTGMIGPDGFRFVSDVFEVGVGEHGSPAAIYEGKFLSESGYNTFPAICPRWDVVGEDTYGCSLGMDVIDDIKAIQVLEKRKGQAVEKMVVPPMKGPSSLRNQHVSLLPGAVTYVDGPTDALTPIHEVRFQPEAAIAIIQEHESRVHQGMHKNLFQMWGDDTRSNITATEIQAREQERMLQLGPALDRQNRELLNPIIDRAFAIMESRGLMPPVPPVIEGLDIKVEFVSIMAQAQKMIGISGIDRLMGFVGGLAAMDPTAMDKIDMDEVIEHYSTMLGVPTGVLRSEDEIDDIRERRSQQMQEQHQAEMLEREAGAAKVLAETDVRRGSALDAVASEMRGPV